MEGGHVVTASAYVVWRGRYVFMVGFPGDARDRLGMVRLGGHREEGEGAWECAAREVMEESGLRVRPLVPPATYWFGADQDERSMVAAPWPDTLEGGPAPFLVGWRPDPDGGTGRRVSVTYLTEGRGTPVPESETQGLLLLRPKHVKAIATKRLTLSAILAQGAEVLLRAPLPTDLPLVPLTQLRALAILLDRHPALATFS